MSLFASELLNPGDLEPPVAVSVDNLWVRFRTTREHRPTFRGFVSRRLRNKSLRTVDALRGVSFDVPAGSVFGVIGRNGAGKSTLFRVIAGIYKPTAGRVTVYGRVTPLLSLGLGFNRALTGRENILLGGLANGLPIEFVREKSEEIIAFADIGSAIDSPMRTYSSGMFARVGFAVAAFLQPEILLIDEALGAGDAVFRSRAREKIMELCESDTTIMIITHGLELLRELGEHAVWLEEGQVIAQGDAGEMVDTYLAAQRGVDTMMAMEDF